MDVARGAMPFATPSDGHAECGSIDRGPATAIARSPVVVSTLRRSPRSTSEPFNRRGVRLLSGRREGACISPICGTDRCRLNAMSTMSEVDAFVFGKEPPEGVRGGVDGEQRPGSKPEAALDAEHDPDYAQVPETLVQEDRLETVRGCVRAGRWAASTRRAQGNDVCLPNSSWLK